MNRLGRSLALPSPRIYFILCLGQNLVSGQICKVPEKELSQYFPGAQVDFSPADQALNAASVGAGVPLTTLLFLMLAVMLFWESWIVRKE